MLINYKILSFIISVIVIFSMSCSKEQIVEKKFSEFNLNEIRLVTKADLLNDKLSIEMNFTNESLTDSFWIPISHWEINNVNDNIDNFSKGFPGKEYIVNYFVIQDNNTTYNTMIEKAPGPIFKNFPKLLLITPKSQKKISVNFKINERMQKINNLVLKTFMPIINKTNLNNLYSSFPFKLDNSIIIHSDEINVEFYDQNIPKYPWFEFISSNNKLDSIYDQDLFEHLKNSSTNLSTKIFEELNENFDEQIFDENQIKEEIVEINQQKVNEYLNVLFSTKIISYFQQKLKSKCLVKVNSQNKR